MLYHTLFPTYSWYRSDPEFCAKYLELNIYGRLTCMQKFIVAAISMFKESIYEYSSWSFSSGKLFILCFNINNIGSCLYIFI